MKWSSETPTQPGWYVWRRRGYHLVHAHLVALDTPREKGKLRVATDSFTPGAPKLFVTARSLRGEWIGPLPEQTYSPSES